MTLRSPLLALALVLAAPALAKPPFAGKGGTDVLHLSLETAWHETADPASGGAVELKLRQQGNADVQKAGIVVEALAPESSFSLFVFVRGVVDPALVQSFDTDADGDAELKLKHLGHGNASGKVFPPGLDPVTQLERMEIRDAADATVLAFDLEDADRLAYFVKRRLTNEGADADAAGRLFLKQRDDTASFRLDAGNLEPNGAYELVINGTSHGDFAADADGELRIDGLPVGAPLPFAMESIELLDAADQAVLTTELP